MEGAYSGVYQLGELKKQGDFGIGTFDNLDGEMYFFNSEILQIRSDGKVYNTSDTETTPFCSVHFFEKDFEFTIDNKMNYQQLKNFILSQIPTKNLFYAIKISGEFAYIKTRAVPAQKRPFLRLIEVTKNQPEFEIQKSKGTIIGYFCPEFVKGVNVPEFHLHYVSADKTFGGHLLNCELESGNIQIDKITGFSMILPENSEFSGAQLKDDKSAELKKIEN